jgi:hypothetical protein
MLKQIPKSDINLRPFKAYKNWDIAQYTGSFIAENGNINFYVSGTFYTGSNLNYYNTIIDNSVLNSGSTTLTAAEYTNGTDLLTPTELNEKGLYHQLYTMYYRDPNNPFTSYGDIKPTTTTIDNAKQRLLVDRARVIAIPQIKYGEQIKPFSINIYDNELNETIVDDGHGNLISNYSSYTFKLINIETGEFIFYDANNNEVETTILTLDIENNILFVQETTEVNTTFYLLTIDVEAGTISFLGVFKKKIFDVPTIGNVFYSHGLIVITKLTQLGGTRYNSLNNFSGSYKSTATIYENEVLLIVGEDEFNVSTNPTATIATNVITGSISTTFEGIKKTTYSDNYQKNDYYSEHTFPSGSYVPVIGTATGYITASVTLSGSGRFDKYEYNSSVDPTGSFIAPYITTIGLYDDNMDMVAVAKLATPIKSTPDLPVNFLIRFDT